MFNKVCVMIATYNREKLLIETLNKVRELYKDIDILVVFQNYNLKFVTKIVQEYNIKYYHVYTYGLGVSKARKIGYKFLCDSNKYKYILDLDDDVLIRKNYLEILYDKMEKYINIGLSAGPNSFQCSDVKNSKLGVIRNCCPCVAKLIRVSALKQFVDNLSDNWKIRDDTELSINMFLLSYECVVVNKAYYTHKCGKKSGGIDKVEYENFKKHYAKLVEDKYPHVVKATVDGRCMYIPKLIKNFYINKGLTLIRK